MLAFHSGIPYQYGWRRDRVFTHRTLQKSVPSVHCWRETYAARSATKSRISYNRRHREPSTTVATVRLDNHNQNGSRFRRVYCSAYSSNNAQVFACVTTPSYSLLAICSSVRWKCRFGASMAGVDSVVLALEWMSSMRPLMYFVVTCCGR